MSDEQPTRAGTTDPVKASEERPKRKMSIGDSVEKINTEYGEALARLGGHRMTPDEAIKWINDTYGEALDRLGKA